jgi:predicted dehydrogenase
MDSYYGLDLRGNPGNPFLGMAGAQNWNFQLPGGLFQNLLPHPLSVVMEFLPEPVAVQASARFYRLLPHQAADELRVMLTTPSAGAFVTVSMAASPKFQTLQVYGTHGALHLDFTYKLLRLQRNLPGVPKALHKLAANLSWGRRIIQQNLAMAWSHARKKWVHYDGMQRLIAEFYACARLGLPSPVPPQEALRVIEVMDETWRQIGPQGLPAKRNGAGATAPVA